MATRVEMMGDVDSKKVHRHLLDQNKSHEVVQVFERNCYSGCLENLEVESLKNSFEFLLLLFFVVFPAFSLKKRKESRNHHLDGSKRNAFPSLDKDEDQTLQVIRSQEMVLMKPMKD